MPTNAQTKSFIPEAKLAHFLDFITSSHVIQDLPFGAKTITLSTNEVIQVPNVVRNMIPERIVCQYQKYSAEHDFTPMSRSTLLRILHVCSASTRKSLQGFDYVSCSGAQAFEDLVNVFAPARQLPWQPSFESHIFQNLLFYSSNYTLTLFSYAVKKCIVNIVIHV